MATQVVDFGQDVEVQDEFITHPAGHEGVFRATKDAEKITRNGQVSGVEINGTVDGANVREYLARYRDKETGEMGFAAFRVAQVLTGFGLRNHGGPVNPTSLLKITAGKTAKVRLKVHAYGKCTNKSCGKADAAMADDDKCSCGGLIERREKNEVDRWLEPDAELNQAYVGRAGTGLKGANGKEILFPKGKDSMNINWKNPPDGEGDKEGGSDAGAWG